MDSSKSRSLATVVKPAKCREATIQQDTIYIRDDISSDVSSSRTTDGGNVSNSRETSNMQQEHRILDARYTRNGTEEANNSRVFTETRRISSEEVFASKY